MLYYTGDIHGNIDIIKNWAKTIGEMKEKKDVYLIMLGDSGINYFLDKRDEKKKIVLQNMINELNMKGKKVRFLFMRGNHECRPENIESYVLKKEFSGNVYVENKYPDLLFLKDGEMYEIEGIKILTVGGGYSEDFFKRILCGEGYWFDEQLSEKEFNNILDMLKKVNLDNFYVISHMLPISISPRSTTEFCVSTRTEYWLETIYQLYKKNIKKWLAGHYHTNWESSDKKFEIVYKKIKILQ